MSLEGFLYRIRRRVSLFSMWIKLCAGYGLPFDKTVNAQNFTFCRSELPCLPQLPWDFKDLELSNLIAESDEQACVISHSASQATLANRLCWCKAPDTGRCWPLKFFARIPFEPGNPIGDIQLVWARSRLQNLVAFSLIDNLTDDLCIKRQITRQMEKIMLSWINANPWMRGVNYISTMECALRLISICHAFDNVRNENINAQTWQTLVYLVHSHAYFIRRRLCLFAYAGNHTLGECAGLVYAGILFPELPEAEEWLVVGLRIMTQEADNQILPDGGNREQSFQYLVLMVDLCGLVICLLKHHGRSVPDGIGRAWIRGRNFLQAFASSPENLPAVGDSDDGYALSSYLRLSWKNDFHASELPIGSLKIFASSGYSKILGEANHGTMRFSHGKLGLASTFGHGHADALSVCWDIDGKSILVDPGTYLYDGNLHFRRYFRGTSAHNTITVNDADQALQNGKTAFGWLSAYTAKLVWHSENLDGKVVLLAHHNGYVNSGVMHWRALIYDHLSGRWVIWDYLDGTGGKHTLALHWHVDAHAEMTGNGIVIDCAGKSRSVSVQGGKLRLYRGNEPLPLGWISRKYGVKEPLNTLKIETRTCLPHEFLTIVNPIEKNQIEFSVDDSLINRLRNKCAEYILNQKVL